LTKLIFKKIIEQIKQMNMQDPTTTFKLANSCSTMKEKKFK